MASTKQATAYHEAGHAVIAYHLGYGFHTVTITPDEAAGTLGHINYGIQTLLCNLGRPGFIQEARDRTTIALAGPFAEEQFTGTYNAAGAESDMDRCWQLLTQTYGYDAYDRHVAALTRRTRQLITQHWQDIATVARLLLEREQLTGEDIAQALAPAVCSSSPADARTPP